MVYIFCIVMCTAHCLPSNSADDIFVFNWFFWNIMLLLLWRIQMHCQIHKFFFSKFYWIQCRCFWFCWLGPIYNHILCIIVSDNFTDKFCLSEFYSWFWCCWFCRLCLIYCIDFAFDGFDDDVICRTIFVKTFNRWIILGYGFFCRLCPMYHFASNGFWYSKILFRDWKYFMIQVKTMNVWIFRHV